MKKFDFFVVSSFALLLVLPVFLNISTTFPRLDTDYDSNLPIYQYMTVFIWKFHVFPSQIPLVAKGIPVLGDPLNSFLNPLLSIPFILLGVNIGLRISIFLNLIFSGISMQWLLEYFKIRKKIRLFGSLLYMSSGAFVAQIAAGHIEKFLIYPLVPLLLLWNMRSAFRFKESILTGIIIALTIYSGDLYATWFFLFLFTIIRFYFLWTEKRKIRQVIFLLLTFFFFIIFSFIKLYPFLTSVFPIMQRYFSINPYAGSVHVFLLPLFFVVPFQVSFYDRPFFQHHLGFSFNWYEYYAFLSPFPFIFLWKIKKIVSNTTVRLLLLLLAMGGLYVALAFPYSPFFWFTHALGKFMLFRVPQRIVLPLTAIVVLLLCFCADFWIKEKHARKRIIYTICIVSVLWTTIIFWQTLSKTFSKKLTLQSEIIHKFALLNKDKKSVVTFVPQSQFFLIKESIPVTNYYYGWIPTGTQTYIKNNQYDLVKLLDERPEYVLTGPFVSLASYGYTSTMKNATITLWKRS